MSKASRAVLVVDDTANIRGAIAEQLSTLGYEIVQVETAIDAFPILLKREVDLILLDIMMPKQDGYAFLQRLRRDKRTLHIPVIVCTVRNQKEDVVQAFQMGAQDYIVKPFGKDTLIRKVKGVIGKPVEQTKVRKPD